MADQERGAPTEAGLNDITEHLLRWYQQYKSRVARPPAAVVAAQEASTNIQDAKEARREEMETLRLEKRIIEQRLQCLENEDEGVDSKEAQLTSKYEAVLGKWEQEKEVAKALLHGQGLTLSV